MTTGPPTLHRGQCLETLVLLRRSLGLGRYLQRDGRKFRPRKIKFSARRCRIDPQLDPEPEGASLSLADRPRHVEDEGKRNPWPVIVVRLEGSNQGRRLIEIP